MTEDSPLWDCRTMGNLVCGAGAVLPDGTVVQERTYYGLPDTATMPADSSILGIVMVIAAFAAVIRRKL